MSIHSSSDQNLFVSCDWGSSQLRLALVDQTNAEVLAQHSSSMGAKSFYQAWTEQKQGGLSRFGFGQQILLTHLDELAAQSNVPMNGLPMMISGMASSSLGIEELPYAASPFPLDGSQIIQSQYPATKVFPHAIMLISGVQSGVEVMRGEEVQAIGLPDAQTQDRAIWMLPGTHSKHLEIEDGNMLGFRTFMTGELFELLSKQSTLSDGMEVSKETPNEASLLAFDQGVSLGAKGGIMPHLFQVRSRRHEFGPEGQAYFLSGMLIGAELGSLIKDSCAIGLASSANLGKLYVRACKSLGLGERLHVLGKEIAQKLTILGHVKMMGNRGE